MGVAFFDRQSSQRSLPEVEYLDLNVSTKIIRRVRPEKLKCKNCSRDTVSRGYGVRHCRIDKRESSLEPGVIFFSH
jgi:hypothetical protein